MFLFKNIIYLCLTLRLAFACDEAMITLNQLFAGQPFISEATVRDVIRNPYGSSVGYQKAANSNAILYKYHNGTSPFLKPLSVIALPDSFSRPYALVDAHHRARAIFQHIQELGGDIRSVQIPIAIDSHLKDLSEAEFWEKSIEEGLIYTGIDSQGCPNPKLDLMDIMDVPNDDMRHFLEKTSVTFSARKAPIYGSSIYASTTDTSDKKLNLWVRIGDSLPSASIPFIEFYISDVLRLSGFSYQVGDTITAGLIEKAREVLRNSLIAQKAKILIWQDGKLINIVNGMTPEEEYQAALETLRR